jgi:hypothetical protein
MYLQLAERGKKSKGRKVKISAYSRKKNSVPAHFRYLNEDVFLSKKAKKPKSNKRSPLKAAVLAPGRAAFLAMLAINLDGLATRLAKGNLDELGKRWLKLGGDRNKLIKNLNKGKSKKAKKLGFLNKLAGKQGLSENEYTLAERYYPMLNEDADENPAGLDTATKAKIIAISTGAATAIGGLVGGPAGVTIGAAGPALGAVIIGVYPLIKKSADVPEAEVLPDTAPVIEPPVDNVEDGDDADATTTTTGLPKWVIPSAIGLAALGGLYYFVIKGKKG